MKVLKIVVLCNNNVFKYYYIILLVCIEMSGKKNETN